MRIYRNLKLLFILSLMSFLHCSLPFAFLPVLCNDKPRCGLVNTLWPDSWTFVKLSKTRWRCFSWHLQMSLLLLRWKMFSLLKNRACRSLSWLGRNFSLLAQRVCFTLGTRHISCLFIKRIVKSIGCGEVVRPQAKNTFMRLKLYAHCMQWNELVWINVSSISRPKDTDWRCVSKAWWVHVSTGH